MVGQRVKRKISRYFSSDREVSQRIVSVIVPESVDQIGASVSRALPKSVRTRRSPVLFAVNMSVTPVLINSAANNSKAEYKNLLFAIIAIALLLRIIWALLITPVPVSDGEAYNILARDLVEYGVYGFKPNMPSAFWPPGTSMLYAALYFIFGFRFMPIVMLNIVLSTALVGYTARLGRSFFNEKIGLVAGAFMAISPSEVPFVTIFASEIPFTFLVLSGVAAWFDDRLPNYVRAILSGLAFGAATYFRSIALLLPLVLWLTAVPNWQKLRGRVSIVLLAMLTVAVVIAPWSLRNTKVFGHFVLLSTSDGVNLWIGNNPDASGLFMFPPSDVATQDEYRQNKELGERATQYIVSKPFAFVGRAIKKAVLLHAGETTAITWNADSIKSRFGERSILPFKLITQGSWTVLFLFAVGGFVILLRKQGFIRTLTEPPILIWLYFSIVYSVYFAADRYHVPSHPFISMLAAISICASLAPLTRGVIRK
jgi:4-amino-4-deoxy-L-arabinose transferase-like glycosyltransferase